MSNLTLDAYAKLIAHLACRRGARLEEILAEIGVDAGELDRAEPALRAELKAAWPTRKGISAMKFATALGTELERLGALGGGGPASRAHAGEQPPPPLPADARPREHEVPSFLQAAPAPMPVVPIAPPPSAHTHAEVEPPSSSHLAGTADMDLSAIVSAVRRGALPFNASEGSAPSPSAVGPASDGDLAELPLETYASVTGALARGESREEALARHGLRADVFDRLAKAWAQRFQREPHLLAKFQELARSSAASPRRTE